MKKPQHCRLTPFEEYMLLDDRPNYPMSCFLKLTFRGRPDLETLEKALGTVLKLHPLLQCGVVKDSRNAFFWKQTEHAVEIKQTVLPQGRLFPPSDGIDLFQSPALKVTFCEETDHLLHSAEKLNRAATVRSGAKLRKPRHRAVGVKNRGLIYTRRGISSLVFEFHHSACDAAGAERFVGDLLIEYVQSHTGNVVAGNREPVDLDALEKRADFSRSPGELLRNLPASLWGIPRTIKFLRNRVISLVTENASADSAQPPRQYPAALARRLDVETTQRIRQQAKSLGFTINDLLLRAAFLAMSERKKSSSGNQTPAPRDVLRIAVPINLRQEKHRQVPAANIVSMVFLDRQPERISEAGPFLSSIHQEMDYIKQRKLGLTFIRGLSIYRNFFGGLSRMVEQDRCWSTATVSNLGSSFRDLPFPRIGEVLRIEDDLELIAVDSVPPIRPLSALGICALTFADRMTINMQYDATRMTPDRADEYFTLFLRRLTDGLEKD